MVGLILYDWVSPGVVDRFGWECELLILLIFFAFGEAQHCLVVWPLAGPQKWQYSLFRSLCEVPFWLSRVPPLGFGYDGCLCEGCICLFGGGALSILLTAT